MAGGIDYGLFICSLQKTAFWLHWLRDLFFVHWRHSWSIHSLEKICI